MNIIYKIHLSLKESPYGDAARSAKMMALRGKARGLMMFAGMVRFRLGSDVSTAPPSYNADGLPDVRNPHEAGYLCALRRPVSSFVPAFDFFAGESF